MKKPLIGISPLFDDEKDVYCLKGTYARAIELAGGIPFMLPLTTNRQTIQALVENMDGILFSGGHDIDPSLYAQNDLGLSSPGCSQRDEMELLLFEEVLKQDKPALGICRGLQLFNIALGGDLIQDIEFQIEGSLRHYIPPKNGNGFPSDGINNHPVTIQKACDLFPEKTDLIVNSFHHQSINTLGRDLAVLATSQDGVIEAVQYEKASFVAAVQWHPELLCEKQPEQMQIFQAFLNQASKIYS